MADTRAAKLAKRAAELGWQLDKGDAGYRIVQAGTGTLVAAVWTTTDGYGLDLDEIEAALDLASA